MRSESPRSLCLGWSPITVTCMCVCVCVCVGGGLTYDEACVCCYDPSSHWKSVTSHFEHEGHVGDLSDCDSAVHQELVPLQAKRLITNPVGKFCEV